MNQANRYGRFIKTAFVTAGIIVVVLLMPNAVIAEDEKPAYSVGVGFVENLRRFTGEKVFITLNSGTVMSGFIKDVGDHLLHLEKLAGKEYFDALIRIDDVSAIDAHTR